LTPPSEFSLNRKKEWRGQEASPERVARAGAIRLKRLRGSFLLGGQALATGLQGQRGEAGDAGIKGRLRHCRGDLEQHARIEGRRH